ncbi:MAG: UDP-2,4-diacetamido-2,4,6-trideoxy-beta-L-altropyranose hydrolase, partial [Deltaproteobacteria bacterium]|nr:UDP-2,4-diacetamido-2,4,6-trideoxy-beta-L-altropyranose hydrolase [Deltaproteobacteria bacterium]
MMYPWDSNRHEFRTLIVRADATSKMGAGHIMRCLALAQAFQDREGHVTFILNSNSPVLENRLRLEGIDVVHLSGEQELGSRRDSNQSVSIAKEKKAEWAVLDGYHFGGDYQKAFKDEGFKVLAIDDYGHAGYYWADLVLNQNLQADESFYRKKKSYTRLLLGLSYLLLRREFLKWKKQNREIPDVGKRILVTLGGGDFNNVTSKVIQALSMLRLENLEIVTLVGPSNDHYKLLQKVADASPHRVRLKRNVTDMPEILDSSDLAISAGGSTCWELAFLGIPAAILVLAENQRFNAIKMDEACAAVNLGFDH